MSEYIISNYNIETERLLLRQLILEDVSPIAELCNNYNIYKNTLFIPYPYTLQDAEDWVSYQIENFDPDRALVLAITDKSNGTFMGCISIECSQIHKRCEIGYWMGEKYWNKGFTTEALKALIYYVFNVMEYNRIYARHFINNPASGKVMEKAGMKFEGILKEHIIKNNKYIDLAYYGIIKSEFAY